MATLTEVIRTTESTIGNFIGADALLEWSDEALRLALEPCSQVKLITWRHTEEALSPPEFLGHDIVGILQVIYNHLETAASRSDCLRGGTTDQPQPPNRRAVLLALNDVLHGFKAFSGISGTPVGLVFSYLKKCYEYHLIFARLLFPKGSTNSFAGHEEVSIWAAATVLSWAENVRATGKGIVLT